MSWKGWTQKSPAGLMAALDTSLYCSFHKRLLSPCEECQAWFQVLGTQLETRHEEPCLLAPSESPPGPDTEQPPVTVHCINGWVVGPGHHFPWGLNPSP